MPPSPFSSISHFCIFSGEKLTLILYQLMHRPNGPSHLRFSRPRPLLGRQSLRPLHPADHGARRRLAMAHGQALQICYRLSTDMVYRYDWIDWILAGSVTAQHPHKKWCPEGGRWGWPVRVAGFTNYWCKSGRAKNIIFRCFEIWPRTSIFFYGFHVFLHPYGLPARKCVLNTFSFRYSKIAKLGWSRKFRASRKRFSPRGAADDLKSGLNLEKIKTTNFTAMIYSLWPHNLPMKLGTNQAFQSDC